MHETCRGKSLCRSLNMAREAKIRMGFPWSPPIFILGYLYSEQASSFNPISQKKIIMKIPVSKYTLYLAHLYDLGRLLLLSLPFCFAL